MAFCSHSGSEKMMPNSPSETIMAATLPLRNELIVSRSKAIMDDLLAVNRTRHHHTNKAPATKARPKANGTGLTSSVHFQSPMLNC